MSIIEKLKSVLGFADSGASETTETEVTVEHEPESGDEPVAAATDASASTGSMTEEPSPEPETAAEPAEAAGGVTDHSGTETPADEPGEAAGPVPDEPEAGDRPVQNVSGIGPAYSERLAEAGVETIADLLAADSETLAEEADLSAKRIERWQERAGDASQDG